MNTFLTLILVASMLAVVGSLFMGIGSMTKGGDFNKKYGNKLMRIRVIAQGVALAALALLMLNR